jgi:ATP-dependent exoDNAse (exonuclease V) beta subunit
MSRLARRDPPDNQERLRALEPGRSILVQAPAGSGKTDLLARRFLRLLGEVDEPGQVVAITFTNAAAAEMRNRILDELRNSADNTARDLDEFSMDALAYRALLHSQALGWKLLDLPAQFRIRTIDSFCRELALQQPLLSGFGGSLDIADEPEELYRRAARRILENMDEVDADLRQAIAALLGWRDNNWKELEGLLVEMLSNRDRWMQDFVFAGEQEWELLRERLERPMAADSVRYSEDEWKIVKACFTILRKAAGELRVVFAEAGAVDFTEVAQIAQRVLRGEDDLPTDAAMAVSDNIHHLLVDEFQDTSRRQHQLLASLIAAWPERPGRTCFVVGDPMQSIYFFRDADAELFPRVKAVGLEILHDEPLLFDSVSLTANFRTTPGLVTRLNQAFEQIFASDDGSGITFTAAQTAQEERAKPGPPFTLHLDFVPQTGRGNSADSGNEGETAHATQIEEIVELIRSHQGSVEQARFAHELDEKVKFRIAVLGRAKKHLVSIAAALREAGIPFRAVELEQLATRPEVLDALALARALLNREDRVAWLGVLRAPWSGLSLDDLHRIAGNEEPEARPRPLPELIVERLPLLSDEGRIATARVLDTIASAADLRAAFPTASLGTWLEQIWLRLGGAACVDANARANLDLLWSCLDNLQGSEPELLGPGLAAALDKLAALPDPAASNDYGVQLMTIHKSKGLEFEVVIVPELQARMRSGSRKMLTWLERGLERGLAEPDDSGEITEFLIAPFQPKGADRGRAKEWVDRVYRERESQEIRRILYVAATRAREELHLFARPACKEKDGELTLVEPVNSLLATAWPALEDEVRAHFEVWKAARAALETREEVEIESLAASGESSLAVMPSPIQPTLLRRLPPDYLATISSQVSKARPFDKLRAGSGTPAKSLVIGTGPAQLYSRHEGGMLSRALGTAVHTLLEELARLHTSLDWETARASLAGFEPRIAAQVRAVGVDQPQAVKIAAEALQMALKASHDPIGSWILSPHASAASEAAWAGVVASQLHAVLVDRVFRAGPTPGAKGEDCWWIIDYKTTHAGNLDPAQALPGLRELFAPQLEAYAGLLHNLHGAGQPGFAIRAGLYYPRLSLLDWWEI